MPNVLVGYSSDYGNTKRVAEAVAEGANNVHGTIVHLKPVDELSTDDLGWADGIILGTPVHMGSPEWRIKRFIDKVCGPVWMKDGLVGKVAAVFGTNSGYGNEGSGGELALLALLANFAELGCILVPLPKSTPGYRHAGIHWGPLARSLGEQMEQLGVTAEKLDAARHHGGNVARLTAALYGKQIFAKAR
jgi:NAD(P)H dehydrogenase (quinone)